MRRLPKHNSSAGSGLLFLLGQRPEISFGRARDPGRSYCTTDLPRRLLKTCPEKLLKCFLGRKWRWENEEAPGTTDWGDSQGGSSTPLKPSRAEVQLGAGTLQGGS